MKKYSDIIKDIETARASMRDTAATEKALDAAALRTAHKSGSAAEIEAARAAYKAAEARYTEECIHNDTVNLKIQILRDNAKNALFSEIIGTICDIWNKYENKPHGEKTAQKIRDEIKSATGYSVYIGNKYDDAHITVYTRAYFSDFDIAPIWNGEKYPALDCNNKIVKLNPERMRLWYCGEYVENIDEHVSAIRAAHAAAIAAEKALQDACAAYNKLTRGSMQHANAREGVKHYII